MAGQMDKKGFLHVYYDLLNKVTWYNCVHMSACTCECVCVFMCVCVS